MNRSFLSQRAPRAWVTLKKSKAFSVAAALGAWILAGAAAQPAHAAIVDPASFFVSTFYTGANLPTSCFSGSPCASQSSATVSSLLPPSGYPDDPDDSPYSGSGAANVNGSSVPTVSVAAAAQADQLIPAGPVYDLFSFEAEASLTYYFELTQIAGPGFSGPVPVLMNGSSTLTSQGGSSTDDSTTSTVSMQVGTVADPNMLYSLPSGNDSPFFQSLNILPGVEYSVTMSASASAQVGADEVSNPMLAASASIDPMFTISPAYANDFQLTFSPDIGNGSSASGTPEPSTWAMMLIAFGSGAAMRLRRKHVAA